MRITVEPEKLRILIAEKKYGILNLYIQTFRDEKQYIELEQLRTFIIEELYAEAERRIQVCREEQLVELDLTDLALTEIPEEVFQLTQLKMLKLTSSPFIDLNQDRLRYIPEAISNLSQLQALDFSDNHLVSLPESFGQLDQLHTLNLGWNRLSYLPESFTQLHQLHTLALGNNKIGYLPESFAQLHQLHTLDFHNNELSYLPSSFGNLHQLQKLDLCGNQLNNLPESFTQLRQLRELYLLGNQLRSFLEPLTQLIKLQKLDLGGNGIKDIPYALSNLSNLQELYLYNNKLSSLPESIIQLENLKILELSDNELSCLPDSLSKLHNLQELNLSSNQLNNYIDSLGQLDNLQTLELKNNQLSSLPNSLGQLDNLRTLELEDNHIRSLPDSISGLYSLETLDLEDNQLSQLPDSISALHNLQNLNLGNNNLSSLPDSFGQLYNLQTLNLSDNQLRTLPHSFGQLQNLYPLSLNLWRNQLTYPPQEIADRGIQAIRNYFIEYRANHDTLHELKLLLVGEERVGKTSIAKSLTIPDYQLEDEPSTEGIDIHTWIIPKEELNSEKDFRVNIWDFGGQEIYHATHQFFLTKRSLYLLVTATPQESDGKNEQQKHLYHWCNVIRLLGGQSPILVTLNKIDLPTRDVGIEEYYKLFDTIIHPFAQPISCHSSRRDTIESLKAEIKRILKDKTLCPNVGESLPKIWIDIRHALADLRSQGTDYITSDEYYVLCAEHGMAEEERANFLSDFLHDIGVILHFREDFDLSDLVVLNPEWVTNGVYKVLINPAIIAQQGRFHRSDLMVIWRGTDYYQYRHKLLALMLKGKFEICYALPDSAEEYLIPQLLPEREMAYAWRSDWHNLRFEYRYKFMPKGLLPRFIVKCHQQIYQRTHWRYGVLLDDDETRALVQEHPPAQKITIRLEGKNKRDMLYSIRKTIKEIHRSFNNLVVDEMIPCPCAECAARNEPHFYRYASLQRFIEKGRIHVMCEQSAEDVDIHSLLSDTVYAESRHDSRQLRHRLAECYPDELRIRRVLADAEIAAKRIRFDGDAESVWQAVLMEAENSGRLNALLDVVRSEYNINTSIKLRNINYD